MAAADAVVGLVERRGPRRLSAPSPTPEELVARIANDRDRDAFVALFELYAPKIKGYMIKATRDERRADDLTQEVMLRVWRRASSYSPERAAFSTWVFTIARNARIDALRKEKHPEVDLEDPTTVVSPMESLESTVDRRGRRDRLLTAIRALPEEQASVLMSAYYEDKSLRQVAEEQQVPLGTIKSRVRLAMNRLRTVLAPEVSA